MTDPDRLLEAARRERRRIVLVFATLLAIVTGTLTVGWISAWEGREAWHEQAMTWQDRYIELYDEFTAATGEEPAAPDPGQVAGEAPAPVDGAPGPIGPAGPRGEPGRDGRDPTAVQIADAVTVYCAAHEGCAGPAGAAGAPGAEGASGPAGPAGATGADGAPGAAGSPGVSITAIACMDDGTWRFTMSDGTTIDVPGPCRTPTPEPLPEGATQ